MAKEADTRVEPEALLQMATRIVAAYVSRNAPASNEVPTLIQSVYRALAAPTGGDEALAAQSLRPAVPVKRSITPEYLVCLEDGKKLKMLKRHLRSTYGLTPEEYRAKWGLPVDYPMVAPNYSEQRSAFAKKIGLGRKPRPAGQRRGRRRASA